MLKYNSLPKEERQRLLKAVHRLKNDSDFEVFREFIAEDLNRLDRENRKAEGSELFRNQGAAQFAERIEELITDCGESLKQLNGQQ